MSPHTRKMFIFLSILFTLLNNAVARDTVFCSRGTLLVLGRNGTHDRCDPCPEGFFNDQGHHRQVSCAKCSFYDKRDRMVKIVSGCTPYRDTVAKCRYREFFFNKIGKYCKRCRDCESKGQYLGRNCTDHEDSICCSGRNMIYRDGGCRPMTFCGVDEYLAPWSNGRHDECRFCPRGTTNYERSHQRLSCQDSCLNITSWGGQKLNDRLLTCRPGECKAGKSCRRMDGVMCTVCPSPNAEDPSNVEQQSADGKAPGRDTQNLIEKFDGEVFHITILVVSAVAVVLALATVVGYVLVKRSRLKRQSSHYAYTNLLAGEDLDDSEKQYI